MVIDSGGITGTSYDISIHYNMDIRYPADIFYKVISRSLGQSRLTYDDIHGVSIPTHIQRSLASRVASTYDIEYLHFYRRALLQRLSHSIHQHR